VKIYIVAKSLKTIPVAELVGMLAFVEVSESAIIPIIALDELYNLPQIARRGESFVKEYGVAEFLLKDFREERQQASLDQFTVDINLLVRKLDSISSGWGVVDFEENSSMNVLDFVKKFGHYIFTAKFNECRNFLFFSPDHLVAFYARHVNEVINSLPIMPVEVRRSGAHFALYASMYGEVVARIFPRFILKAVISSFRFFMRMFHLSEKSTRVR